MRSGIRIYIARAVTALNEKQIKVDSSPLFFCLHYPKRITFARLEF